METMTADVNRYIYTRSTYIMSSGKQNEAILEHFATEWNESSQPKRYTEKRLKIAHYQRMLKILGNGDIVYCYNPAIFGIGVDACVKNIRKVLAKGARIKSVLFGEISEEWANQMQVAGEIVRECCEIECQEEERRNRGVCVDLGGYFKDGIWYEGESKVYRPPFWAWQEGQCAEDKALDLREMSAMRWIDMKIMQAWTTERIWKEYCDLRKAFPNCKDISKGWINSRRLELIK